MIWRIYWLAGLGLVAAVAVPLIESWKTDLEVRVPAEEVTGFEQSHAPGVDPTERHGAGTFLIGLGFALALTIALCWAAPTSLVYAPAVPMLLAALAIAHGSSQPQHDADGRVDEDAALARLGFPRYKI